MTVFERLHQDVREAVLAAGREARGLRQTRVAPVHLLLGLSAGQGTAARVLGDHGLRTAALRAELARRAQDDPLAPEALATLGIDLDEVRRATEASFGEGALDDPHHTTHGGRRPWFTPAARKALELSLRQAIKFRHKRIGSGHVLLGILQLEDETIDALIRDAGVTPDSLRAEVTRALTSEAA